ncbi:hypothetical protein DFJ74DRAFT_682094 [Hyaloraphidium curvatum]|nr:hypothetical protein DFJ74DRAFT_682094 [Hyaloraphidium curvatum]
MASPRTLASVSNFLDVLPPIWRLQLFLGPEGRELVRAAAGRVGEAVRTGRIALEPLPPPDADLWEYSHYQRIFKNMSWWRTILANEVLVFQTDTALCRGAPEPVDAFVGRYDFVGAPQRPHGGCANGGLSLRRRNTSLAVLAKTPGSDRNEEVEDMWWCRELRMRGHRIAPLEVAKRFAVETVYFATPAGVHKPWHWLRCKGKELEELEAYCPEVRMLRENLTREQLPGSGPDCTDP